MNKFKICYIRIYVTSYSENHRALKHEIFNFNPNISSIIDAKDKPISKKIIEWLVINHKIDFGNLIKLINKKLEKYRNKEIKYENILQIMDPYKLNKNIFYYINNSNIKWNNIELWYEKNYLLNNLQINFDPKFFMNNDIIKLHIKCGNRVLIYMIKDYNYKIIINKNIKMNFSKVYNFTSTDKILYLKKILFLLF